MTGRAHEFVSRLVAMFNEIQCHTGDNIRKNQEPANRGDAQEIVNHTTPDQQCPQVTRQNGDDSSQACIDKPGVAMFFEKTLHDSGFSCFILHQGQ